MFRLATRLLIELPIKYLLIPLAKLAGRGLAKLVRWVAASKAGRVTALVSTLLIALTLVVTQVAHLPHGGLIALGTCAALAAGAVLILRRRGGYVRTALAAKLRHIRPAYWLRGGETRTTAKLADAGARMAEYRVDVEALVYDPTLQLELARVPIGTADLRPARKMPKACAHLAAEEGSHIGAIAGTGSGKTESLTKPAILSSSLANTCMVVVDPTGGLLNDTLAWRSQCGAVSIYDPANERQMPESTSHWSPLALLGRSRDTTAIFQQSMETALRLCVLDGGGVKGVESGNFFALTASNLLTCMLVAATWGQLQMHHVTDWIVGSGDPDHLDEVEVLLEDFTSTGGGSSKPLTMWRGFRKLDDKQKGDRYGTLATCVGSFLFPEVERSADLSDPSRVFDSRTFLRAPSTHYIVGSSRNAKEMTGLYVAHVGEIVQEAIAEAKRLKRKHGQDKVLPHRLILVLEEVAQMACLPNLPQLLSEVRQYGIRVLFVFQDYSQMIDRYGREGAQNMLNNTWTQLFFAGQNDPATKDLLRDLGQAWSHEESTHLDADGKTSGGNRSRRQRELLPVNVLPRLAQGKAILISRGAPPAEITTRYWRADPELSDRVNHAKEAYQASRTAGMLAQPDWTEPADPSGEDAPKWLRQATVARTRRENARAAARAAILEDELGDETPVDLDEHGPLWLGDPDGATVPNDAVSLFDPDPVSDTATGADLAHWHEGCPVSLFDPSLDLWVIEGGPRAGEIFPGPPDGVR